MYCTSDLRKKLFEWNFTEPSPGDAQRFVSRQLQELFAEMQMTAKHAAPTTRLTRSFGWKEGEAFMQNDIHECMSVLYDELVAQTVGIGNGETVSSFVRELSNGRMENYTKCLGCGRTSVRPDEFKSLMLPVRGCPDLPTAFASLLTEEKLDGRNQYFCDECGCKQDALRGQRLPAEGLPSTLYVSLNRFEFDYSTMQRKKVNDRLRPALVIDMAKYVHKEAPPKPNGTGTGKEDVPSKTEPSPSASAANAESTLSTQPADSASAVASDAIDESSPLLYDLVAVLMHIGAATAGHYFAYVRTANGWLHFNDSSVTAIDESLITKALGQLPVGTGNVNGTTTEGAASGGAGASSTGGAAAVPTSTGSPAAVHIHDASVGAYMLLYRRRDTLEDFLTQPDNAAIPADLRERIEVENGKYLAARKEWEIEQRKVRLRVFFDPRDLITGGEEGEGAAATAAAAASAAAAAAATTSQQRSVTGAALLSSVVPDLPPLDAVDVTFGDEASAEDMLPAVLAAIEAQQKKAAAASSSSAGSASASAPTSPAPASSPSSGSGATGFDSASASVANPAAECPPTASRFNPDLLPLFRLRHYNSLKGVTLAPVEPRQPTTTTTAATTEGGDTSASASGGYKPLVKHTGLVSGKQLVLERRPSPSAPWPMWSTGSLPLKLVLFHPISGTYMLPQSINVPPGSMNVAALRTVAAQAVAETALATGMISNPLQTPRVRLILLKQDSEEPAKVLADDAQMLVPTPSGTGSASSPSAGTPAPPLVPAPAPAPADSAAAGASSSGTTADSSAPAPAPAPALAPSSSTASASSSASAAAQSLRLSPGDVVHVELCPLEGPGSDYTSGEGSVVAASWDSNVNTVSVTFNVPASIPADTLPPGSIPFVTRNAVTGLCTGVVSIDQRLTLAALKEQIAAFLGIKHDDFRVKRAQGSIEFKDTAGTLFYYSLVGGGSVWIDMGRPLQPDEYEFKVSLALPPLPVVAPAPAPAPAPAADAATAPAPAPASSSTGPRPPALPGLAAAIGARAGGPGASSAGPSASANTPAPSAGAPRYVTLGPLAMKAGASGAEMKAAIHAAFGGTDLASLLPEDCKPGGPNHDLFLAASGAASGATPSSTGAIPFPATSHMRLRERTAASTKLGRVLVDDKSLLVNYGGRLADGKEVVIQPTRHAETSRDGDLLIVPVRWNALTGRVTTHEEAVFPASTPMKTFAGTVAHRSGVDLVPGMVIKVAKPLAYHLADCALLWGLRYNAYELGAEDVHAILHGTSAPASASADATPAGDAAAATPAPADGTAAAAAASSDAATSAAPAPAPSVNTLSKCGWTVKSGDMLLFTLQDEFEHPDAFGKVVTAGGGAGGSGYGAGGTRRGGEDAFKIWSPEEQRKREAAAKEKEEREKKEREERSAALAASMAARMAAGGALPSAPVHTGDGPKPPPLPTNVRDVDSIPVGGSSGFLETGGSIVIDGVNIDKYYRFLQLGMEPAAVRAKMVADGVDPGLLPHDL